jgi:hypothetical protein
MTDDQSIFNMLLMTQETGTEELGLRALAGSCRRLSRADTEGQCENSVIERNKNTFVQHTSGAA